MTRKPFNPELAGGAAAKSAPANSSTAAPQTVWQITQRIKHALENGLPATVRVVGQLSNTKHHTSGHFYFTLKDERSELAGVMWRSAFVRLKFQPEDGLDVVVSGSVGVFERAGRYQLYARQITPQGVGALEIAFRQMCAKLEGEGLFDPRHKKSLPRYPRRVVLLTSATGAAIQDLLDTLRRRYPAALVYLRSVPVQGTGAATEIARAIAEVNRAASRLGGIDVMIVGRGGGSAEDLGAFNEEVVARAIFASAIPIISAVGHETDITVADLVADVRAATPTAAAELAVPRGEDVLEELEYRASAMRRGMRHRVEIAGAGVAIVAARRALADPREIVAGRRRRIMELKSGIALATKEGCHSSQRRLARLAMVLQRLHPQRFLADRMDRLMRGEHRLRWSVVGRSVAARRAFASQSERMLRVSPRRLVGVMEERLAAVAERMRRWSDQKQQERSARLDALAGRLQALSHETTLARGFSITRSRKTGRLVRRPQDVREGERVVTRLSEGEIESRVVDRAQGELFD